MEKNPGINVDGSKKVMIIGSGIVGQATGKGLIKRGISDIVFVDTNPRVLETLSNEGYSVCTPDSIGTEIDDVDISMFCLPTPFDQNLSKLDLKHVNTSLIWFAKSLRIGLEASLQPCFIIITVPP